NSNTFGRCSKQLGIRVEVHANTLGEAFVIQLYIYALKRIGKNGQFFLGIEEEIAADDHILEAAINDIKIDDHQLSTRCLVLAVHFYPTSCALRTSVLLWKCHADGGDPHPLHCSQSAPRDTLLFRAVGVPPDGSPSFSGRG